MALRAYASVRRSISSTSIVLHSWRSMSLLTVNARGHESRRRSCCGAEAGGSAHTIAVSRLACMRTHRRVGSGVASDSQWVLGEADTDTSLVAVVELYTVQFVKRMRCIGNVLILDETHGAVLLCAEAKSLEPSALGKQRLQLVLASVDWQVSNVQSIARRILIGGVGRRIVMLQVQISARIVSIWSYARTSGGS
jgi:hypothetical protein